jgi:trans-L-3-hydroxyproline dehydratase
MSKPWTPPEDWQTFTTIDAHTAGEPLRVVTTGLPEIPGSTILEKQRYFREHLDPVRTSLMWEPRGHADMYGAVLTEAVTEDGDLGVIFLHNEGYSSMCGHGIIALTKVVLDTGMLERDGDSPLLRIDSPAGRIVAVGQRANGRVVKVSFTNVPSYVYRSGLTVELPGGGTVTCDIAFGGAFYAFCDADALGLSLGTSDCAQLIDLGRRIKHVVSEQTEITHPYEDDLGYLYGTIFVGSARHHEHHSRNVCIFADGEVDRSPTGTGVSARAAIHHARGELVPGQSLTIESILSTCFDVRILELTSFGEHEAVIPEVTGSASIVGQSRHYIDPQDPLGHGFFLR